MKKFLKRFLSTIVSVSVMTVVMAGLSGCGSNGETADGGSETVSAEDGGSGALEKVVFGTSPWPTNMFAYLAKEKGIFEKNGIDVDIQYFPSTTDSSSAFISGNLDICTYASPDIIPPVSEGADFDVIIMSDKSMGSDGMVVKPEINDIKDLKGKTVGTQLYSVDHMYLLSLLDRAGMSADDVTIVDMTIGDAGTAFIAGQLDAASIWEPFLSKAVASGGKLLYSSKDDPDLITDSICASKEMTESRPDVTQAFVDSWYEAIDYWKENTEEAEIIMAKSLDVTPEEFRSTMETIYIPSAAEVVDAFTPSESSEYYGYTGQKMVEFLKELDVIQNEPIVADYINDTFVKATAAKTVK